jgi:hypothetical protein
MKAQVSPEEEARCEEIAKLMLAGNKGEQLAQSVRQRGLDVAPSGSTSPVSFEGYEPAWPLAPAGGPSGFHRAHRRSSSLPPLVAPGYGQPAGPIVMPTVPSFSHFYRSASPVGTIAASSSRHMLGHRRASSVQLAPAESWLTPSFPPTNEERAESPLPEMDTSLFNPSFSFGAAPAQDQQFSFDPVAYAFSPTDSIAPHDFAAPQASVDPFYPAPVNHTVQYAQQADDASYPSTSYSGSPSPSDSQLPIFAPRAQHISQPAWDQFSLAPSAPAGAPMYGNLAPCAPSNVSPLQPMQFGQQNYYGGEHSQFMQPNVEFTGVYTSATDMPQFQFDQFVHDM